MQASSQPASVPGCIFCLPSAEEIVLQSEHFYSAFDKFPVNPGHLLIVSRRHVADFFDLREVEAAELFRVLASARTFLQTQFRPDGYNIGINCGEAAGQTVMHFHLHLIPRFAGDVENPRGGVRNLKNPLKPY